MEVARGFLQSSKLFVQKKEANNGGGRFQTTTRAPEYDVQPEHLAQLIMRVGDAHEAGNWSALQTSQLHFLE